MTGGVEKTAKSFDTPDTVSAPLAVTNRVVKTIKPAEARIERDPETGAVRVIEDGKRDNPLNDPLNELDDDDAEGTWEGITAHEVPAIDPSTAGKSENPIIRQLEELAASSGKKKAPRKQSEREVEWVERLVNKYGDDYGKMNRDMKLNPMQQSEGDIKRRVKKWQQSQ